LILRGMGLNPTMNVTDFNRLQELYRAGNTNIFANSSGAALAGAMLTTYVTTNSLSPYKTNDKKIDEYARLIDTTLDPVARKKIVQEAEKYVVLDQAYYPAWYTEDAVFGYRTYLKGEWVAGYSTTN